MLASFIRNLTEVTPIELAPVFGLALLYLVAVKWDKARHFRFVLYASSNLKKLSKIQESWKKYEFLRGINPFVFEEMLLTAFKRKGWKIKRNKRYTGDGGIDGMVHFKGDWYAIQAKRYSNYINANDVLKLSNYCYQNGVKGLFIHTGKTGGQSRQLAERCPRVQIVSGKKMLKLLEV